MPQTRAQARKNATAGDAAGIVGFSKLPIEIRLEIWRLACMEPRVIAVWGRFVFFEGELEMWEDAETLEAHGEFRGKLQVQRMSPPTVLHISREAREVGLMHYTLGFGNREGDDYQVNEKGVHQPFFYINWDVDILFPTTDDAADGLVHHLPCSPYRVAVDAAHKDNLNNLRPLLEYDYTLRDLGEILVFRTMGDVVDMEAISQRVKNAQPIECQFLLPEKLEQSGQISEIGTLESQEFIAFSEAMKDQIREFKAFSEAMKGESREKMDGDPDESDCSDYGSPPKITFGMMKIKTL